MCRRSGVGALYTPKSRPAAVYTRAEAGKETAKILKCRWISAKFLLSSIPKVTHKCVGLGRAYLYHQVSTEKTALCGLRRLISGWKISCRLVLVQLLSLTPRDATCRSQ